MTKEKSTMKTYTIEELQKMDKPDLEEHLEELLERRRQAYQRNDLMDAQWISRSIDWVERLIKYKKWE
jgi:hypothetical protein